MSREDVKDDDIVELAGLPMRKDCAELLTNPILWEEVQKEIDREILEELLKR